MRTLLPLVALPLLLAAPWAVAQAEQRVVLWDFEEGIDGWWSNPWSGGKAQVEQAEGKYGRGLRCSWEDVPRGGNNVSPYLPEDAPWREGRWSVISLWFKGDGSQGNATLAVHCAGPEGQELSYSKQVPLDSTDWRRASWDLRTFWNRERVPINPARIRRILFGCSGTHELTVDQIALEARQRPVPLEADRGDGLAGPAPELFAFEAPWLLRLDPTLLERPGRVEARVTWPGGQLTTATAQVGEPPTDDALLWLTPPDEQPGEARLAMSAAGAEAEYRFPVAFSLPPLDPHPDLLPTPKRLVSLAGEEPLALDGPMRLACGGPREVAGVAEYVAAQLRERWGVAVDVRGDPAGDGPRLELRTVEGGRPDEPTASLEALRAHGPEAYALRVSAGGAVVLADDRRGLRYGAVTLLQLVAGALCEAGALPAVDITDWPDLPLRGITIPLPTHRWGHPNDAPVDPEFYEEFLLRTCLEHKLNTVVLLVLQGMKYNRRPQVDGPAAWPQETVRRLVETLKAHDITPIPLLNSLGHANWLVIPLPELREDGDTQTLCTRHPDSRTALLDCYEEVIEVFRPTHFHMGLDEVRWQTFNKPPEERCPRCLGVDKRDIFVEQVTMLHEFLTARGITPMMWGDMVLRTHNGGPPFQLADTLERLPRDIVITNWSITLDQLSNHLFRSLDFPVIQANSRGVTPAQARWVEGNLFGVWDKHPWLTEGAPGVTVGYSYLSILAGAEYGWNLYPDAMAPHPPLEEAFFAARMGALARPGLSRPVGRLEALPGPDGATPEVAAEAGRVTFGLWPEAVAPTADEAPAILVGRRAAALYALVAAEVPEGEREEFRKLFQHKDTWKGLPVGDLVIEYADGTTATRPLLYGFDLRDAVAAELPYAYNAVGYRRDAGGRTWYALQWVNPHPDRDVTAVRVRQGTTAAQVLVGAMGIEPAGG